MTLKVPCIFWSWLLLGLETLRCWIETKIIHNWIMDLKDLDFNTKSDVKKHTQNVFDCDICKSRFTRKTSLYAHKNYAHNIARTSECEICNFTTHSQVILRKHIKLMHGDNIFTCEQCSFKTNTPKDLRLHIKRVHVRYACETCKKEFTGTSSLYGHKKYAHNSSRSYLCEHCNFLTHSTSL